MSPKHLKVDQKANLKANLKANQKAKEATQSLNLGKEKEEDHQVAVNLNL